MNAALIDSATPLERPKVSIRRVQAVVNAASGGVAAGAAEEMAQALSEFGLDHGVSLAASGEIEAAARAALDADPDLVVVLGGDGTARLVAELCGPAGPLVAPLCGGTMSKLSRALYGPMPWREALTGALINGEARFMPGGEVGGRSFYCSAVLGSPALWAGAREALRAHRLGRAWRHAVVAYGRTFRDRLRYRFDGAAVGRCLAIGLICPSVSRALDDEARALEAAVLDLRDTRAGIRLALSNLFGDWRDDPDVTVRPCVSGWVSARNPIPGMLDGELFRLGRTNDVRFHARAFRALAPPPAPEAAGP